MPAEKITFPLTDNYDYRVASLPIKSCITFINDMIVKNGHVAM